MDLMHFGHSGSLSGEECTQNHTEQSAPVRRGVLGNAKTCGLGIISGRGGASPELCMGVLFIAVTGERHYWTSRIIPLLCLHPGKMTFISEFAADLCAMAVKTDAIGLTAAGGFLCAYLPGICWSEKRRDFADSKRFGERWWNGHVPLVIFLPLPGWCGCTECKGSSLSKLQPQQLLGFKHLQFISKAWIRNFTVFRVLWLFFLLADDLLWCLL